MDGWDNWRVACVGKARVTALKRLGGYGRNYCGLTADACLGDDLCVPNADSMYQDRSASAIELHRCDRQWCRVPRPIDLSAASLLPIDLLIRRYRPMVRPGTMRVLLSCRWRRPEAR